MAMTNIDSTKVKVYPAAGRSDAYKNSYLLTEDNLNTAIRCLYQRNFVVSYAANIVKFVIHGYYFEVDLTDSGIDTSGDLYAVIYLKQVLAQGQHSRLVSSDGKLLDSGDGKFNGVYFTTKESEITNKEGLDKKDIQILSGGQVPEKSYLRFKTSEILDRETNDLISSKFTTDSLTTSTATISSATISTANIPNATISTAQITTLSGNTTLDGVLVGGTLSGATLSGATLSGGTLSGATLSGGTLSDSMSLTGTLVGGTLSGTTLSGITSLTASTAEINTLSGTTSLNGVLTGGTISGTTLSGTTSLNGALQTAGGSITPTNIMTNANLKAEVEDTAPKTLVISLVTTKGKD